ncbi:MAG: type I restriction enzyme HsdR N-terminal domain-containing protein [Phycisphaeraceae bacterium]|nr:type I restriction enzyme HsdR N-terminal domain-containing protein [Phycisphaeraceae bacterium]
MMAVPKRVAERILGCCKAFQQILTQQKSRDVSEADTVTIVKDLLSDLFGYDKYAELTSEHAIRGTYCDLAVKLDGKLAFLIEVKAIGLDLKDGHVKQAIDYAANQGVEWVVLTNGICWRLYHVLFKKPIDKVELASFDMLTLNPRNEADMERLYLLTREGFTKSALTDYRDKKEATSRFMLAAIILNSESVVSSIRREIRKMSDILVDEETIIKMLREQVIKRDVIEGDSAETAGRRVRSASSERKAKPEDAAGFVAAPASPEVSA